MTIQLIVDNVTVPIKTIKFSDGSSNIKLEVPEQLIKYPPSAYYAITVETTTPADNYLWEIELVNNAVFVTFGRNLRKAILNLPYLAHARADRVFENGNAHPLNVFLNNIQGFDEIHLTDPHSDFYQNYAIDFVVKEQHDCFIETVKDIKSGDVLISPDKGALKKIYKLQKKLDYAMISTTVIEATKKRDITTGKIIETTLPEGTDLTGKRVFIVDDIGDGLATFIPLAEKLRGAGAKEVHLYLTHLIAAKGLELLRGKVDKLHIYQCIGTYTTMGDVLNFNNGKEVK